jgi:hypothetical protein
MECGIALGTVVGPGGLRRSNRFDRDRSHYSVVLIVIASYCVLFAAMDSSGRALEIEIAVAIPEFRTGGPGFVLAVDVVLGAPLAIRLMRRRAG